MLPSPTPAGDGPAPVPVPPELLAWARQTFDAEAFLEEMRETEATGGQPLEAFITHLEAVVRAE